MVGRAGTISTLLPETDFLYGRKVHIGLQMFAAKTLACPSYKIAFPGRREYGDIEEFQLHNVGAKYH